MDTKETNLSPDKEVKEEASSLSKKEEILKLLKEKSLFIYSILLVVILALGLGWYSSVKNEGFTKVISEDQAKEAVMGIVSDGVEVKDIVSEKGLYKITLDVRGEDLTAYISKDGEVFFPNPVDVKEISKQVDDSKSATVSTADVPKTEKPNVEVFVMSHCPFGTQIEKGILPVAEVLGDSIDFEVKFVDYAMHGEKEIDEQLNQYCIQSEQKEKFNEYLNCFLEDGNSDRCLSQVGIDVAKMNACVSKTDSEYKINELFADKATWSGGKYPQFNIHKEENDKYGVAGSPTLVVNGVVVEKAKRDSASLLKTICGAFENQPGACSSELPSANPSSGFGKGEGVATDADCN